jgi:hypothetical protein
MLWLAGGNGVGLAITTIPKSNTKASAVYIFFSSIHNTHVSSTNISPYKFPTIGAMKKKALPLAVQGH